jgi:hypothetical protein
VEGSYIGALDYEFCHYLIFLPYMIARHFPWTFQFPNALHMRICYLIVIPEAKARGRTAVRVYTDGSGLGGEIGAVAVLYKGEMEKEQRRYHLGSMEEHTVYERECMGVLLGLELMKRQ